MDIFGLRNELIGDYRDYVSSFITVRDERIDLKVEEWFDQGRLWPDPMVGLNPTFSPGGTVEELVDAGTLHERCRSIFRAAKVLEREGLL